ncbi:TPA: hypothetical protein ACPSKZ_000684 [Legionella anisa]|uniref:hypothetical protein n=1 Tax=Legionella anisa TaxID=28082 RepID=UPI0022443D87|nr:hypothetical protein [Legionella anisa]MCW8425618.1 hypothetical protein [Legionella anisa]MCW8448953.1 hypothetical protein [Legionella anisa]
MAGTMGGGWNNPDYGFDPQGMLSGLGGLFGGLFADSGAPYDKAMEQYQLWANQAQGTQQPYLNAGKNAIGDYQNWLTGMKDPSKFINNLMSGYQASPYSQYLQQQAIRAAQNAGSASGMIGSTPYTEQIQQNAANIASGDMNQWLQNVLGINTQYGQGQNNLMTGGQNAANTLTQLYAQMAQSMGDAAYGKEAGKQQDFGNIIGGIGNVIGSFL